MPLPGFATVPSDLEFTTVKVFRDSPEFEPGRKWWQVPMPILTALYVGAYDCREDTFDADLAWIRAKHPGCVLVY